MGRKFKIMEKREKRGIRACFVDENRISLNKRSQITIFIIVAIILVALVAGFFLLRGKISLQQIPKDLVPVYDYYSSCIEERTNGAINLAETQAGYIYVPEFERGNELYPSSSQLDFYGFAVPYWSYTSISGQDKQQVPGKTAIEKQIATYLESEIPKCDFNEFRNKGIIVERGSVSVNVKINDNSLEINVDEPLAVSFGEENSIKSSYKVSVASKLGKLYNTARNIFSKQQNKRILENYGIDVLRLYAPVDGVELSCAPKIWNPEDVVSDLLQATEANVAAIKLKSNDYKLSKDENKYFIIDYDADENVRFFYSKNFPTKIEVWPADNNMMIAEPVGLQEGLGILGFCYVPYHFVYDFVYPVLIQVGEGSEVFQFPVVVKINKNQINPVSEGAVPEAATELCKYKNTEIAVYTYNSKLEPVAANISFECLNTECDIGATSIKNRDAVLVKNFPQCVNGFILAKANGYKLAKYMVSTDLEAVVNIPLEKEYELDLSLKNVDNEFAVVTFESVDNSFSVVYPEQKKVKLSEGEYNVSVSIYKNSTINFPAVSDKKCIKIPKSGLSGFLGGTEERCFDVNIPAQTITFALSGGGKQNQYFIETELEKGKTIEITASKFKVPSSLDELQNNYIQLEASRIDIEIR